MDIILIDTSVWVNFFKGIATPAALHLRNNVDQLPIAICPTVLQEILQGVKSEGEAVKIESYFDNLIQLIEEPYELAIEAAQLYRNLRKKGITIRKPNDCLIAVYAIKNKVHILHDDIDFVHIAQDSELKLVEL